jgi:hypothetical protein
MNRPQPDFLIIGAAKSGSTWLVKALIDHPDVFIPQSEIHYFSREFDEETGLSSDYLARFDQARLGQMIGENSNSYLTEPEVASRVSRCLPKVRLLALLRNPIERAYSGYCMQYKLGHTGPDIDKYFEAGEERARRTLRVGLYYQALMRYTAFFPRQQLFVGLFDDIVHRPEVLFDQVCEFLEIGKPLGHQNLREKVNAASAPTVPPRLKRWLVRFPPTRAMVHRFHQSSWYRRVRPLLAKRTDYPRMSDALRERLIEYYINDIESLSKWLGRDLSHWIAESRSDKQEKGV